MSGLKRCYWCRGEKSEAEFGADKESPDGLHYMCRACVNARARDWRAKRRAGRPPAKRGRPRKGEIRHLGGPTREERYVAERMERMWKKYRSLPPKRGAQEALTYALRTGLVTRGVCAVCGSQRVHGHHVDYSKPLDVVWLCSKHHYQVHRETRSYA